MKPASWVLLYEHKNCISFSSVKFRFLYVDFKAVDNSDSRVRYTPLMRNSIQLYMYIRTPLYTAPFVRKQVLENNGENVFRVQLYYARLQSGASFAQAKNLCTVRMKYQHVRTTRKMRFQ